MSWNFGYSGADDDSEYVPSEYIEDEGPEAEEEHDDESESGDEIGASTLTQGGTATHDSERVPASRSSLEGTCRRWSSN